MNKYYTYIYTLWNHICHISDFRPQGAAAEDHDHQNRAVAVDGRIAERHQGGRRVARERREDLGHPGAEPRAGHGLNGGMADPKGGAWKKWVSSTEKKNKKYWCLVWSIRIINDNPVPNCHPFPAKHQEN